MPRSKASAAAWYHWLRAMPYRTPVLVYGWDPDHPWAEAGLSGRLSLAVVSAEQPEIPCQWVRWPEDIGGPDWERRFLVDLSRATANGPWSLAVLDDGGAAELPVKRVAQESVECWGRVEVLLLCGYDDQAREMDDLHFALRGRGLGRFDLTSAAGGPASRELLAWCSWREPVRRMGYERRR